MIKLEICENTIIHEDNVNVAKKNMLDEYTNFKLANLFKVFGDETRIKIMRVLQSGELCVCDISSALNMTHSSISHQLKILREVNLVKYHKVGKVVYYYISDDHVNTIINYGLEHIREEMDNEN